MALSTAAGGESREKPFAPCQVRNEPIITSRQAHQPRHADQDSDQPVHGSPPCRLDSQRFRTQRRDPAQSARFPLRGGLPNQLRLDRHPRQTRAVPVAGSEPRRTGGHTTRGQQSHRPAMAPKVGHGSVTACPRPTPRLSATRSIPRCACGTARPHPRSSNCSAGRSSSTRSSVADDDVHQVPVAGRALARPLSPSRTALWGASATAALTRECCSVGAAAARGYQLFCSVSSDSWCRSRIRARYSSRALELIGARCSGGSVFCVAGVAR